MRICFLETEAPERAFFEDELADHEVRIAASPAEAPADTEVLSIFIESPIDAAFLAQHPALRLIATRSTTFDHIDLEECARRGVTVCAVGSYGDHTVAEHTMALILALCRRLRQAMQASSSGSFSYEALRGTELHGKTLGVMGAGRIGRETLRLGRAFGMETIAQDVSPDPAVAADIGFTYVTLDELLARSHFISLNIPLTPETLHLFDRPTFAKCRRGVILINTARGRLIDTDALIEALNDGIVGGAGLDVLEDERVMRRDASRILVNQIAERVRGGFAPLEPLSHARVSEVQRLMHNASLLAHPNVVFTPHIAFNSIEAVERIALTTVENIRAFIAGTPQNVVSAPA